MLKLQRLTKEDSRLNLLFFWMVTAIILILAFFVLKVPYSIRDDRDVVGLIGGIKGQGRSQYTIPFIGVALSWFLAMLSNLTGIFNTYGIFIIISISFVFFVQHYLFYKMKLSILCHIILCFLQCILLLNFTFTVVAFSFVATGLVWGYVFDCTDKKGIRIKIIPAVLIYIGLNFRLNAVYIIILFLPLLAERIISKKYVNILSVYFMAAIGYIIVKYTNQIVFNITDIGQYHKIYNSRRAFFVDYPEYDYNLHKGAFDKIGWTENIYKAFYSKMTADKNFFGYNKLNELKSFFGLSDMYQFNILNLARSIINRILYIKGAFRTYFVAGSCMVAVLWTLTRNRIKKLEYIFIYIMPYVLFLMILIRQRFLDRVAFPFLVFGIVQMLLCTGQFENKKKAIRYILSGVVMISLLSVIYTRTLHYCELRNNMNENESVVKAYDYINEHKENLYVNYTSDKAIAYYDAIGVFDYNEKIFQSNVVPTRGFECFSEGYYNVVSKYNVTDKDNIFYSLAMDENIYFMAPEKEIPEIYKNFMKDAYGLDVVLEQIEYFDEEDVIYAVHVAK